MRVVHIITGLGDGGAEGALFRLCAAMAAAMPEVTQTVVSLTGAGKYGPQLESVGVTVHSLNLSGEAAISGVVRLVRILRDARPDVVQTWMYHANLLGGVAARVAGMRNVLWNIRHSHLDPQSIGRGTRLVDWLCARLSGSVPRVIVSCSSRAAEQHVAMGYAASKFSVIPNGYDMAQFAPDPLARQKVRSELGIENGTFLVGLVGRWHPQKDHATLLKALSGLTGSTKPWQLVLVGTGMDAGNAELAGLIEQAGFAERVQLLGRRNDIPAVMSALDLHVLSSSDGEAFPNVVAEAMACGTPCVVTDVGDAAYIVGDSGWVVSPRQPAALAAAIGEALALADDSEAWMAKGLAARSRVLENFRIDAMLERYLRAWQV